MADPVAVVQLLEPKGGGGGGGEGFDVKRTGDARVGLVGFPSVGKSTLLTRITGTASLAAAYEFTTLTTVPGTFFYKGAKVQLLDLPGIIEGAKDGKGRGRQVIGVARTCDLILIALDAMKPLTLKRVIENELEGFGIRLNRPKPNITIRKKDKGGVFFTHTITPTHLDKDLVESICKEYKVSQAGEGREVVFCADHHPSTTRARFVCTWTPLWTISSTRWREIVCTFPRSMW